MNRLDILSYLNELKLNGIGVEVGVQQGYFSKVILDGWKCKLFYLVDIWQPQSSETYNDIANVATEVQISNLKDTIHQLSSHWNRIRIIQLLSSEASRLFDLESLDFVYLDANHSYEGCKKDLELWYPKIKTGGVIAGHDYPSWPGVKQAVDEFFKDKLFEVDQDSFIYIKKRLISDFQLTWKKIFI